MPTNNTAQQIKSSFKDNLARALVYNTADALTGIIPSKPGRISRWIFPHFACVLFLGLTMLWCIPHPEIIKTTATITGISANDDTININIAPPENARLAIRAGQSIQIKVKEQSGLRPGIITGKLLYVSPVRGENELKANVLVLPKLTFVQYRGVINKNNLKVNLVVIAKELRLLQCIFRNPLKR